MPSEIDYQELFEWAQVPFLVVNPAGQLLRVNQAACDLLGYSREELLSLQVFDLSASPDSAENRAHLAQILEQSAPTKCVEHEFKTCAGTLFCAEVSTTPLLNREGKPHRIRLALVDLTERRQIELLLSELDLHRVRWETTLRQLPGGVLVIDTQGRIMLTNDWMQKLLRHPLPDVHSASLGGDMAGWRAADGAQVSASLWPPMRCLRTGQPVTREELIFDIDGNAQVHLEVSASPITDRNRQVIAVGCLFFDITAQRLIENSFRTSEARYRNIFEQDIAANFILTGRLDLVACNGAAVALFGFPSKKEMFAPGQFPAPVDRTALRSRALSSQPRERRYLRLHRNDGRPVLVAGTLRTVRDSSGEIQEIHGHFADVTERRRAEKKISVLSTRLLQVQNEERRKLSYDLHDSAGQNLSALSMNLGIIETCLQQDPGKAAALLAESKDLVRDCIRDIRTISYTLHPPLLDELGLNAALRWFIEGFSQRSSIEVELDVTDNLGRLGQLVEIALFRIVQEALTNVHRHSGSKTASVQIRRDQAQITLIIADRGRGISNSVAGVGLTSIRQQLAFIDGRLDIEPGLGTQLVATIPTKALRNS